MWHKPETVASEGISHDLRPSFPSSCFLSLSKMNPHVLHCSTPMLRSTSHIAPKDFTNFLTPKLIHDGHTTVIHTPEPEPVTHNVTFGNELCPTDTKRPTERKTAQGNFHARESISPPGSSHVRSRITRQQARGSVLEATDNPRTHPRISVLPNQHHRPSTGEKDIDRAKE